MNPKERHMTDLLARLEVAEAWSRELDAALCDALFPVRPVPRVVGHGDYDGNANARMRLCELGPTWSLDAALYLASLVLPGRTTGHLGGWSDGKFAGLIAPDGGSLDLLKSTIGVGNTPALALCIAIMKATHKAEGAEG
jgi:hypothetical protein